MVLSIPRFRQDFGREYGESYVLDTQWQSAFYAGPIAASVIGTFGAAYVADKVGRKPVFIAGILASFAAVAPELVTTTNPVFFGGKFINGWTAGVLLAVAVTYIGEVSRTSRDFSASNLLVNCQESHTCLTSPLL
jgi:MFS family permease